MPPPHMDGNFIVINRELAEHIATNSGNYYLPLDHPDINKEVSESPYIKDITNKILENQPDLKERARHLEPLYKTYINKVPTGNEDTMFKEIPGILNRALQQKNDTPETQHHPPTDSSGSRDDEIGILITSEIITQIT